MRPAWAEIDLAAVTANVATLADLVAPAQVCAVVKAHAYGHGAVEVARAALDGGATRLAVALAAEGAELRAGGVSAPIIVLSQASADELDDLVANRLEATVYSRVGIEGLTSAVASAGADSPLPVHLKVDTGMHRVGAQPSDVVDLARDVKSRPELDLVSVFTHCAVADEPDNPFTARQLAIYERVLDDLASAGIDVGMRHAANTAAALAHPASRYDLVRCGIGIYGLPPSPSLVGVVDLRPVMSLRARVSYVKRVGAGEGLSYGLHYRPDREVTIATVPLGYADGVPRRLGMVGAEVLIGGRRMPMAGTVTMDQFMVDCGDYPVGVGDEVVLIGRQGSGEITADEWAALLGTINYEVVCGVSLRVPRQYGKES